MSRGCQTLKQYSRRTKEAQTSDRCCILKTSSDFDESILEKLDKPAGMVFDLGAGILATAYVHLLERRHRKTIGSDMESDCIELTNPSLIDVFAEHVLRSESYIEQDEAFFFRRQ